MVQRRPMYDAEFREDALQILRETKRSIRQVSEDLGISQWTLRGWVRAEVKKTKSEGRPRGRKRAAGEQMEQSLEAKLKELEAALFIRHRPTAQQASEGARTGPGNIEKGGHLLRQ